MEIKNIVTRFAPSPTGDMHIGGARTALFNWLYARAGGGKFILRIEDTDRERSTKQAIDRITKGMEWLGLDWDELIFQTANIERHKRVADSLIKNDKAYLDDGAVRLKIPSKGTTIFEDEIYGKIAVDNSELHDVVILRSDGMPTYMLAVTVDDHDEGISDVIRGVDHLTNTTLQVLLYQYMEWELPRFAHIPLIHGEDGAKLSKRHGALSVEEYRDMGFLSVAMRNYLLRLGWSHKDDEIISDEQALQWFKIKDIGKSPACFDLLKLRNINKHYMMNIDDSTMSEMIKPFVKCDFDLELSIKQQDSFSRGMKDLKERSCTLQDIVHVGAFYLKEAEPDVETSEIINDFGKDILTLILPVLEKWQDQEWDSDNLLKSLKEFGKQNEVALKKIMQSLRAVLTGKMTSPSILGVMMALGAEECIARIQHVL